MLYGILCSIYLCNKYVITISSNLFNKYVVNYCIQAGTTEPKATVQAAPKILTLEELERRLAGLLFHKQCTKYKRLSIVTYCVWHT